MYILLASASYTNNHRITSGIGQFGSWQEIQYCPKGQTIVGFNIRSEKYYNDLDDAGAVNFAAYCGDPFGSRTKSTRMEGKNHFLIDSISAL